MLSVYTRHSHECDHRDDINWRRCRCPKWIQGVIADDRAPIRVAAKTRSWEQAEAGAREMESTEDPSKPKIKTAVTIVEAVSSFRADEDGRCLEKTTVAQSRCLFENQLLNGAVERGLTLLTELTTPELTKIPHFIGQRAEHHQSASTNDSSASSISVSPIATVGRGQGAANNRIIATIVAPSIIKNPANLGRCPPSDLWDGHRG